MAPFRLAAFLMGLVLVGALVMLPRPMAAQEVGFCGKYRGVVTNSLDPLLRGRVQVVVPLVSEVAEWALPAVPFERFFVTPAAGQQVWVEYDACDPASPIWTGGLEATCAVTRDGTRQRCRLDSGP